VKIFRAKGIKKAPLSEQGFTLLLQQLLMIGCFQNQRQHFFRMSVNHRPMLHGQE
jgi:hypothetical protein